MLAQENNKNRAFTKRTCSKFFRDFLIDFYPNLEKNAGHWRLLIDLLFSPENRTLIYKEKIARYYGESHLEETKHFSTIKKLEQFQKDIIPLTIKEYEYTKKLCREAQINPPQEVIEAVIKELNREYSEIRVNIVTGNIWNSKMQKFFENEELNSVRKALYPQALSIQEYLNNLPVTQFNKMRKYIPEALEFLKELDTTQSKDFYYSQKQQLIAIKEQPKPIYSATKAGNTARLFAMNMSIQSLSSKLRTILTQEWIDLDLTQAHLAIVAKIWEIPIVQKFLEEGNSIWQSIIPFLGYEYPNDEMKFIIKPIFYSLVYGRTNSNLKEEIDYILGVDKYELFITHPIVEALLEARKKRLKKISSSEFYTTPLKNQFKVRRIKNKETGKRNSNVLSILSCECSEMELILIEPIFKYAMAYPYYFQVLLYQFDGVSIYIKDKRREEYILTTLKGLIDNWAKRLEINTTLEIKI